MDCKQMKYKLPSGNFMPLIGFGTYQIRGRELIKEVLDHAFASGYRAIDTAAVYGNETDIGIALKELLPKYNLQREDIFITSKLSPSDHGPKAIFALQNSIKKLDCGYLDLYLIHWPGASGVSVSSPENAKIRAESWKSLVLAKEKGYVNDIGVSNYTLVHLKELLGNCFGVKPAVNQVEWHPHYHEDEIKNFCQREGILLQAYSSLGGTNNPKLITDPVVLSVAKKANKSPAQILLLWALQQNVAIIPKARSKQRIEANINLNFKISDGDMALLSNFKQSEKYAWNPNSVY